MEESATYLDTNVFIYAAIQNDELGINSRRILDLITIGKIYGFTSCLTFDEFVWVVRKLKPELLVMGANSLLESNLKFVDVNKLVLQNALDIIKEFNLKPRDAIHAATAISPNIDEIISEDKDFDSVRELKRINPINV